jgi:ATP-binding protein involved in chromosome partitioning
MVESGAVTNVVTFGDEVVVDLVLHIRRRCTSRKSRRRHKKTIHDLVSPEAKVKVNTKVEAAVAESPNQIRKIYSWVKI